MRRFSILSLFLFSLFQIKAQSINGSVSSAHPLATKAGYDILKKGGNAFDAAVAIAAALNVVEPMMSGIGGYGTILIYDAKTKQIRFLNASGRFPEATNTDLMRAPTPDYQKNRIGPKSISTPGNLNAWALMHHSYGTTQWADLFVPAIDYAERGFIISKNTAGFIQEAYPYFSSYAQQIFGQQSKPLEAGDRLIQKDLATTFKRIASEGVDVFYQGSIAKQIDAQMKTAESFLRFKDLQQHQAEWWNPLQIDYKGYSVYTASLPANSFAAFVNLGLMREAGSQKLSHNSGEYLHLFAEMTKLSYKARLAYSFDPDIRQAPLDSILSTQVLRNTLANISKDSASLFKPPFSVESKNTTHFVVIDQWGNMVSATQTLGNSFGSRVFIEGTGICMNNSMAYSTFEPKGNPMDAFPGRHKLSGDCPVIILKDGLPWAALGTPGGHTITQNVPQIIFNLIDHQMNMQSAIDAPKIAFVEPNFIRVDPDMPEEVLEVLRQKGHQIRIGSIGNAHGIRILRDVNGKIIGYDIGTDKRGDGKSPVIDR
ncbi:MAG: gamma-glutamyltransferase [Bacteroidota bacterium]|jgi:gamma-glutamyltranspeptidase/glutathione hydrolase